MLQVFRNIAVKKYIKETDLSVFTVSKTEKISPSIQRVFFWCEDLNRFDTESFHVRLILPRKTDSAASWLQTIHTKTFRIEKNKFEQRVYTIRGVNKQTKEFYIDFVTHLSSRYCPGSDWAISCKPNFKVGLIGPNGTDFQKADYYILLGDETALPCIARQLEHMHLKSSGEVYIEVNQKEDIQDLKYPKGVSINWIFRNNKPAQESNLLLEVLDDIQPKNDINEVYFWFAGEKSIRKKIQSHIKKPSFDHVTKKLYTYWKA